MTITIVNANGSTQTITRTFTVNSGEPILPLTSSTPSAEITHLACVNQACVSIPGSGVDSCSVSSDCEATENPPVTGAGENMLLMSLAAGVLLLFVSVGFLVLD